MLNDYQTEDDRLQGKHCSKSGFIKKRHFFNVFISILSFTRNLSSITL
jgi:hypothetical protein